MAESDQNRPFHKPSHLLADEKEVGKLLAELPSLEPLNALADAAASLQSLELATSFGIGQRLNIVSTLDEAVQRPLTYVFRTFLGLERGKVQGTFQQWKALREYWEQLAAAYGYCIEVLVHNPRSGPADRLPLIMVRSMRALGGRMKIEWMRYLAPQDATWAAMVRLYKVAVPIQLVASPVTPYRADADPTSIAQELTGAVMLQAAAPFTLAPRRIELVARIASTFSNSFECSETRSERCPYFVNLDHPGRPVPVPEQLPPGAAPRYIGSGLVITKLNGILQHVKENGAAFLKQRFGDDFGTEEKIAVLEHLLRYWGDSPPSRRHKRTSLQATIKVVTGLEPIRDVLAPNETRDAAPKTSSLSFTGESEKPTGKPVFAAATETWKLSDFSPHGLGAGFTKRSEGVLKIGTPFIFKLERSPKWCLAVVRRLQSDERNQTEVGAQILSKVATLVKLDTAEGLSSGGGGGLLLEGSSDVSAPSGVPNHAVLLHADSDLKSEDSLVFEPGPNLTGQTATMRYEDTTRRIKLGEVIDRGEGYERVAFEAVTV